MSREPEPDAKAVGGPTRTLSAVFNYTLIFVASVIASIIAGITLAILLREELDLSHIRNERSSLLELREETPEEPLMPSEPDSASEPEQHVSAFDAGMREVNPDYVCWISIEGTQVDYPVVRGDDNTKYLNLSFSGEANVFGALFMDYRCYGDYVPHTIIYGHNSRRGDLFGSLNLFLDEQYLAERPIITITENDKKTHYEIFSARKTSVDDPAYFLDFSEPGSFRAFLERCGAPENARQIITLSTCVTSPNNNDRFIIQAAVTGEQ